MMKAKDRVRRAVTTRGGPAFDCPVPVRSRIRFQAPGSGGSESDALFTWVLTRGDYPFENTSPSSTAS
jgi:hypothetical protein